MTTIFIAVGIVAGVALIAGVGLAVASAVFAVPVDEKAEEILEQLPGANCGACGFSGCSGYASALSKGETKETSLCAPGGNAVSEKLAGILGYEAGNVMPMAAVVMCQGIKDNTGLKYEYSGVRSCKMATQLYGGPKECIYGCIGFGDCVSACPYDAIHICDGVARINPLICRACKMCVKTCPKGLIEMLPLNVEKAAVLCRNKEKGAVTRKQCKAGCIGCQKCLKVCPSEAITISDNLAHVDFEKCTGCGACNEACPVKSIDIITLAGKTLDSESAE